MEVIALVGPSGTGKSHRALIIAHDYKADGIIDDGILIKGSKIIAGYSAKNEPNKIQAVKRAIFSDDRHVQEVITAIDSLKIKRLLIIGTSVNMILRIATRLQIPTPVKYIKIEDIATRKEMAKARASRLKEGKHIIPVPTIELKPHFSGQFIDPILVFFNRSQQKNVMAREKSIVRPSFSYYGKMLIDDAAVLDVVGITLSEVDDVDRVRKISMSSDPITKVVSISVGIYIYYGVYLPQLTGLIRVLIKDKVEYVTGMSVGNIDISILKLVHKEVSRG